MAFVFPWLFFFCKLDALTLCFSLSLSPSLSFYPSLCRLSSQIITEQIPSPQVATLFSDLSNMTLTFICIFYDFCIVFFIRLSRVQALPWLFIMRTWFENEVETKWIIPSCERIEFNNTVQHNSKTFFRCHTPGEACLRMPRVYGNGCGSNCYTGLWMTVVETQPHGLQAPQLLLESLFLSDPS